MEASLTVLYIVFGISIALYVIAGIVTLAFVLPLQVKEAGVHNGLRSLRKQMLTKGVLSLIVIIASIVALTARYFPFSDIVLRYVIVSIILIHALGTLGKTIVDFQIYHQQYSPKSKAFHKKIGEAETLANRRKKG